MKEYVFYIAPGLGIVGLHAAVREDIPSYDVQCVAIEEPDWDSFRFCIVRRGALGRDVQTAFPERCSSWGKTGAWGE